MKTLKHELQKIRYPKDLKIGQLLFGKTITHLLDMEGYTEVGTVKNGLYYFNNSIPVKKYTDPLKDRYTR